MKNAIMTVGVLVLAAGLAAAATVAGSASAVYHEGVVTFRVHHPEAVSIQVQVFDGASDAVIYDSGATRGDRLMWPAGQLRGDEVRYLVRAWDGDGRLVVSQNAVTKGVGQISTMPFDSLPAGTTVKGGADPIVLEGDVTVGPAGAGRVSLSDEGTSGRVNVYDTSGGSPYSVGVLGRSNNGVGGYVGIQGSSILTGWSVDGIGSNGQPSMSMLGSPGFVSIDTGLSGDAAVQLPAATISAVETANEPGVAGWNSTTTGTALDGSLGLLVASTIEAPTSGYVVVTASCSFNLAHSSGTDSGVEFGISLDQSTLPNDQDKWIRIPDSAATGSFHQSGSAVYVGAVSAGSHTFTLMGRELSGSVVANERNIAVMFFPTAYGTVSGAKAGFDDGADKAAGIEVTSPWTWAELEAERLASHQANQERIAHELVLMEQRLAELEAQMEAAAGAQR